MDASIKASYLRFIGSEERDDIVRCFAVSATILVATLWGLVQPTSLAAQDNPLRGFVNRVFKDEDGDHKYAVFIPRDYDSSKKWPVILFLHGAGERGNDGVQQTRIGLGPYIKAQEDTFPFIAVFPQCEKLTGRILNGWSPGTADGDRAIKILDTIENEFNVDATKRFLTGWSMGGYGAWDMAAKYPKRWAAVAPLAGGANSEDVSPLKDVRLWAFHGKKDDIVFPLRSRQAIDAVKKTGGAPKLTEYSKADHDVWRTVYGNAEFYEWLLNSDADVDSLEKADAEFAPLPQIDWPSVSAMPFKPAVEIRNAIYARMGNDFLEAIGYAAPSLIPKDTLSGKLEDIKDLTTIQGRDFNLLFSEVSYSGEVERIKVKAVEKNRVNILINLQNLTLTVGSSQITGRRRNATASAINIYVGHVEPIPLVLNVEPYVENRKLGLKLIDVEFSIPADNYSVSEPESVSARGLGMTRRRVSEGLVDGFYSRRKQVEDNVKSLVPALLTELEKEFTLDKQSNLVNSFWPLPVYKPEVQVWPSEVVTDADGISITLGMSAAAIEGMRPAETPTIVDSIGLPADRIPKTTDLRVGLAPQILNPLTQMLVDANVGRIHVLDIVDKSFSPLVERSVLEQSIPDLKRFGPDLEIATELVLAKPLSVVDGGPREPSGDIKQVNAIDNPANLVVFDAPHVIVEVSIREPAKSKKWIKYAEFDIQMQHTTEAKLVRAKSDSTAFQMSWTDAPAVKISGHFAKNFKPQNVEIKTESIAKLFSEGWSSWTKDGPVSEVAIPDIEIGSTRVRLSSAGWKSPHVFLGFSTPPMKLVNNTKDTIVYETKGPYSDWGGPYTIRPGQTHEYTLAYPLILRREVGDEFQVDTLSVGVTSEFTTSEAGEVAVKQRSTSKSEQQ
ncbi:MAG: hypothetical protein CMJ78_25495 [Planctomycetaceae bacterium]|nr:hypothetical protein [Planctomycetaceae bacterium]